MKNKRNKKYIISKNNILTYICIAAVLILVPTGYGYWTDNLQVTTSISTGFCDLAFTQASIINPGKNDKVTIQKENFHNKHEHANKHETDIGDRLHIHINNDEPNSQINAQSRQNATISFNVTNFGTAPAVFKTVNKVNQSLDVKFAFTPSEDDTNGNIIIPPGSRSGQILLTFTPDKNYNLIVDIVQCAEWNKYEIIIDKETT